MNDTCLLLVGHGSRLPESNREILRLAGQWRERHPDWRIETCFIEHAEPLLDAGLDRAAASPPGSVATRRVIAVPLILNAAGHVKMELPAAVAAARQRHPGVRFECVRHLGMGRGIFAVLKKQLERLMRQLAMPDPRTTGVILLGRGSSDAGANGELARMARWLFEDGAHELVDLAFTGVAWPRLETVVQRQARLGMTQIAIVPVYLFTGVLIERIQAQVERLSAQYPTLAFALGAHFGFDPDILALLDARVGDGGQDAGRLLECDGCKYRQAAEAGHPREDGPAGCTHRHGHPALHHSHA